MSSAPTHKPQRIPPPRVAPSDAAGTVPPKIETNPWAALSVATDAFALQAEFDRLSDQFGQLKKQLRHMQKLASIGTTAAMVAHEFNNLLTPVVAYARQALDGEDVELMRTALSKTLQRAEMLHQMADRIVGLAKHADTGMRAIKLLPVVEHAIGCLGRDLARDNIELSLQVDPGLAVRATENGLLQVLLNLVINARQAMLGHHGRLTIDAAPTRQGRVEVHVRDTGCGIKPEDLERIFEPFFSTKQHAVRPDQRGLGLGLPICRDIMTEFGGLIEVESTPGAGTTFTLTLAQAE